MSHAADLHDTQLPAGATLNNGQFVITNFLASGGFGMTYVGEDRFNRKVVIKECFPATLARRSQDTSVAPSSTQSKRTFDKCVDLFLQEARTLASIGSDNVVNVQTSFEENGTAYMVMDFVDGSDFQKVIDTDPARLTPDYVLRFAEQILNAVKTFHAKEILHRDIKPGNILVDRNDRAVMIDFGAARVKAQGESPQLSTLPVVADGYSPNEFYVTGTEQGPASDLYSVAATFYAAITGYAPTPAPQRYQIIGDGKPDPVQRLTGNYPGFPELFLTSIDKTLALSRRDRIQSADEWLSVLAPVLPGSAQNYLHQHTSRPVDPEPERRRSGGLIVASVASLLVGVAASAMGTVMLSRADTFVTPWAVPPAPEDDPRLLAQRASEANAEAALLRQQISTAQTQLEQARTEVTNLTQRLQAASGTSSDQVATLQGQLTAARTQLAAAQEQLRVATENEGTQVQALRNQLNAASADAARTQQALVQAQTDAAALRTQLTTLEQSSGASTATLQRQVAELNAQASAATTQLNAALARQAQEQQLRLQAEQSASASQSRIQQLETALAQAQSNGSSETTELRQELSSAQTRLLQAEGRVAALTQQVTDLQRQITSGTGTSSNNNGGEQRDRQTQLTDRAQPSDWIATQLSTSVLQAHAGGARSVAFSPSGDRFISGGNDNIVRVWDATGQEVAALEDPGSDVTSVSFSPDGRSFAAASDDGQVYIWDAASLTLQRAIQTGNGFVQAVDVANDGTRVAAGLPNHAVHVYNGAQGAPRVITGHSDWVSALAFSPDGTVIASGSYDTTVRLTDPGTGRAVAVLPGNGNWIRDLEFRPDGRVLLSASQDTAIRAWSRDAGWQPINFGNVPSTDVTATAYTFDGNFIVSGTGAGQVQFRDGNLRIQRELGSHGGLVTAVAFSNTGRQIVSASDDGTLLLLSLSR